MHFSIPETEELFDQPDQRKGQFTVYKVHINGVHHCSVRYSALFQLHNQLKTEFGSLVPEKLFPPKKLLTLTDVQVGERRVALEKYFQALSQEPALANSGTLNNFLINAQKEVQLYCEEVKLQVYLANGKSVTVDIFSSDETDEVLEAVIKAIGVNEDLTYYFGLYLLEELVPDQPMIVRKVQDFEAPYISLNRCRNPDKSRIQVRKAYWSPQIDGIVGKDATGLNLIYSEAMTEIKNGHWECPSEIQGDLKKAKESGKKNEFLEVAKRIPLYNHVIFDDCEVDLPVPSKCIVGVGPRSLVVRDASTKKDAVYGITRIRCWKISGSLDGELKLAFHFLRARDDLVWITITCKTAIFMSMCLQGVVDELIRCKKGERLRRPKDRPKKPRKTPKPKPPELIQEEKQRREEVAREDAEAQKQAQAGSYPRSSSVSGSTATADPPSSSGRSQSKLSRANSTSSQTSAASASSAATATNGSVSNEPPSPSRKSFFGGSKGSRKTKAEPEPPKAATTGLNIAFTEDDFVEGNVGFGGIGDDDL